MDAGRQHHLRADLQGGSQGRLHRSQLTDPAVGQPHSQEAMPIAGLDPAEFSAHGLRSGFMTQAGRDGIPLVDAMRQSAHRSVQQASGYYDEQEHTQSRAVRIDI
jgi:integrase